jgi:pimeloyl-ACP methyl ester carboxylesterase
MRVYRLGIVLMLASVLLAACGAGSPATVAPAAGASPKFALADCLLTAPGQTGSLKAQCGTLTVPEDRANASGRKIDLRVAVVAAVSRSPEPDPMVFITGGPGQAATESFVLLAGSFEQIRQKRAIVLVDQRGTGQSGALRCEGEDQADEAFSLTDDQALARLKQELATCLSDLKADPRFYTTAIAVQDLDEVRAALGYEKVNLYGVSYGTRVAQTYLHDYPQHVRTVILDGVVPQAEALGLDVARDAQRALDLIFDRCAAEAACQAAFPNVRTEFALLLSTLEKTPAKVTLPHPVTGKSLDVILTRRQVASAVRLLSYSPETAALLPLLIHSAAQGDDAPLAAQSLMVSEDLARSVSLGMNLAVICAEDAPFLQPEALAQATRDTYLQSTETDNIQHMCAVWPRGDIPADFKQPVTSAAPVLLLSGEADPVTPPSNADEVARTLSQSLRLVVPGDGHNVIYRGCVPRVAADFVKSGSVQGLDTACVQSIRPLPFFVSFTGFKP